MPPGTDVAIARLAGRQFGVFSRAQAFDCGASRSLIQRRVAAGRWEAMAWGVYRLVGSNEGWEQRQMAACLWAGPGSVASHRAAAALLGLDGVTPGRVEISVGRAGDNRLATVAIHRVADLERQDVKVVRGIPSTNATRTVIDLGACVAVDVVEQALESALRLGLTTEGRVARRLEGLSRRGRRGIAAISSVLAGRQPGVRDSLLETKFLQLARRARVPNLVAHYEVWDGDDFVAEVDFAWPEPRTLFELDGVATHCGREALDRDLFRQNRLVRLGWTVIRFTWSDVTARPSYVIGLLRDISRSAG